MTMNKEQTQALIDEVLEVYPEVARADRKSMSRLTTARQTAVNALLQTVRPYLVL